MSHAPRRRAEHTVILPFKIYALLIAVTIALDIVVLLLSLIVITG